MFTVFFECIYCQHGGTKESFWVNSSIWTSLKPSLALVHTRTLIIFERLMGKGQRKLQLQLDLLYLL